MGQKAPALSLSAKIPKYLVWDVFISFSLQGVHDGFSGMLNVLIYPLGLTKIHFKHKFGDNRSDL